MSDISERADALRRWKCTSYCLCGSRKGHFEAHDEGAWVLYTDALAEIDRLRAEVERLTRPATEWQPIETAPRGPACLFWVVPKSAEETWTDTSGWPITARGEPYIVMGPYGDWDSLWKATHWMPLPQAPERASAAQQPNERMSAAVEAVAAAPKRAYYETHEPPHCPTCGCGSK